MGYVYGKCCYQMSPLGEGGGVLSHQVEYLQFAFRWMNNLLMRELPLKGTIRLWDTYMVSVGIKSLPKGGGGVLSHQVEYLEFAFKWMNNLLMRELPLKGTIRLWDTYMVSPVIKSLPWGGWGVLSHQVEYLQFAFTNEGITTYGGRAPQTKLSMFCALSQSY